MPRIQYEDKNLSENTLSIVRWADSVARDYRTRGFSITIRQLYYQGVSQNRFPNSERSYQNLINMVTKGRMAGLIDWELLQDRGREAHGTGWLGHETPSITSLIERAKWSRSVDLWRGQPRRIEIWVEKQALEEVAQRAANRYRCAYIACKGYMSRTEMWQAGYNRIGDYVAAGHDPLILHIGDHDPSGLDMTRDIEESLTMFAGLPVEVRRMALNMEQIDILKPPPQPAKVTDSRFAEYIRSYGPESWELDAVRPEALVEILTNEIESEIDHDLWAERQEEEDAAVAEMGAIADRWPDIEKFLQENPS